MNAWQLPGWPEFWPQERNLDDMMTARNSIRTQRMQKNPRIGMAEPALHPIRMIVPFEGIASSKRGLQPTSLHT